MFRSDSQPTSPEPVANGLPEPTLRELLPCLSDWLAAQHDETLAWKFLSALVKQSITLASNSGETQKLEFHAQELTEACDLPEQDDYEASSVKVKNSRMEAYLKGRRAAVDAFFEERGYRHALQLKKRSTSGRHRAQWFLEPYPLGLQLEPTGPQPVDQPVEPASDPTQQIEYTYAEAGTVECSRVARSLLGTGSFKTKSFRGLVFASSIIVPGLCVLLLACTWILLMFVHRPLTTSDLAFAITALVSGWVLWTMVRNGWWLLSDRIAPAADVLVAWKELPAQLECFKAGEERLIGLVRYTATCPECAAAVELRYGEGLERRRLFGCCVESPQEHVFTFDRVTRRGKRVR